MLKEPSFCYICLDNKKHLVNMDRVDSKKVKLLDMLTYLSFETSCIEDDIPMYICDDCHKNLRAAYDLKVMCQKNNIHVRRYIFYLKQFTHPTSFTNEPEVKNNCKAKPQENTKKKSDEIITIQMDLTDIEVDTVLASQSEQNTTATEVNINNSRILSKRPEFNKIFKQSQYFKTNNKSGICSMKIIKSCVTNFNNKVSSANKVSTVSFQTKILSNRPEFNVFKNVDSHKVTKTTNNNETLNLTQENSNIVNLNAKSNSTRVNNVTNSENNKKNTLLKKKMDKKLEKPVKDVQETKNANLNIETSREFDEFDIISTVKLRKRGSVKTSYQPMNNDSFKKRKTQKMTYHVKKDRKAIKRMNKCKVLLQRCQIVKKESLNSENNPSTEQTNLEMNKNDILTNSTSIEIKEETNILEDCNALENNTNSLLINTSQEQYSPFENSLIKQEIFDNDENPMENDEFSIKIEIVDDTSNKSISRYGSDKIIKLETVGNDSNNTTCSVTNTELNNSVFSFSNAEFLTTCEQSVSPVEDLTKSITNTKDTEAMIGQGNYQAIVGNARVTKSADKPLVNVMLMDDNINTNCDSIDSDISDELIIDEDAPSSEKQVGNTASSSSVTKPAVSKILSPRCARKNVFKRLLNFKSTETGSNTEQGHLATETVTGTVGNAAVDQTRAVTELKNDLSTVHLPNYKFPVNKRVLNFSSKEQVVDNSVPATSLLQNVHNTVTTNVTSVNCKSAQCKTTGGKPASHLRVAQLHSEHRKVLKTTGTPASVNKTTKSTGTLRKLPKKVGNPVIVGTTTEESSVNINAKQVQLMIKYMGQQTEIGLDAITTEQKNNCHLTSVVGSTELSEGTASASLVQAESSNGDKLFTESSNGTHSVPLTNLVHSEGCNKDISCKCTSESHFNSDGLVSPSKITIEKGVAEFLQSEEDGYIQPKQTDQDGITNKRQNWSLKCPICNKYFRTIPSLRKHALIHKNFYHCPICKEKFLTKTKFKVHMQVHEEFKHKCLMCDKRTLTNDALVMHYKSEHKSTKICSKCKLIFKTDSDHAKHMKRHSYKRTCNVCNQTVGEKSYKTHMRSHERSKCSLCDKYFDTKQLNEHNCTEQWEKTYKCTECDRTFYFQPSWEKHMMVHYEMQCFICKITFCKPHAIVEHMSRHIGPKGYQCPICELCTFSKDSMKLHMTGHNGQINKLTAPTK